MRPVLAGENGRQLKPAPIRSNRLNALGTEHCLPCLQQKLFCCDARPRASKKWQPSWCPPCICSWFKIHLHEEYLQSTVRHESASGPSIRSASDSEWVPVNKDPTRSFCVWTPRVPRVAARPFLTSNGQRRPSKNSSMNYWLVVSYTCTCSYGQQHALAALAALLCC